MYAQNFKHTLQFKFFRVGKTFLNKSLMLDKPAFDQKYSKYCNIVKYILIHVKYILICF